MPAPSTPHINPVEATALRAAMSIPQRVMRLLAGPPVTRGGQVLDLETQWMLRIEGFARLPSVSSLSIEDGRRMLREQGRLVGGRQPIGSVRDMTVPGGDGPLPARLYTPQHPTEPSPLLVFFHGGGMLYGDLDSHDPPCRFLAERVGCRVLAVDYRLAPEHPFPAGVDDAWSAYQWVAEHTETLGADPDRLAVGGDSAGGYLSAVVARKAAAAGVPLALQLLVYPATDFAERSESRETFGDGFYLDDDFMDVATRLYVAGADPRDPDVSVLHAEKVPDGLAPALVVTAGFDPLRDEGEAYARLLHDAGVDVELIRYPALIHSFFSVVGVGTSCRAAVAEIAAKVKGRLTDAGT